MTEIPHIPDGVIPGEPLFQADGKRRYEPRIRTVRGVTIVGVDHLSADFFRQRPIFGDVITAVNRADHLLLEGRKGMHADNISFSTRESWSFENLAYINFAERGKTKDIYALEQNKDYLSLAWEAGLNLNMAILAHETDNIMFFAGLRPAERDFAIAMHVGAVIDHTPSFPLDITQFYERTTALTRRLGSFFEKYPRGTTLHDHFVRGLDIITYYMQQVRDAQVIGPELAAIVPDLTGKKVVMLGMAHMENVEDALLGNSSPQVGGLGWDQYYETLDPVQQLSCVLVKTVANSDE